MADRGPTQVDRLQAGILRAHEEGNRAGDCRGVCRAIRRMIDDRGLLAELSGRALVADLVHRYGATFVRPYLDMFGLRALAEPVASPVAETMRELVTEWAAELEPGDANSPEGVGAKDQPGGWTGGVTTPPPDPWADEDCGP